MVQHDARIKHPVAGPPRDALPHFASLLEGTTPTSKEETARTIAKWILSSVDHWRNGDCTADDVRVINEALAAKWLPNDALASPKLAACGAISRYGKETTAGARDRQRRGRLG